VAKAQQKMSKYLGTECMGGMTGTATTTALLPNATPSALFPDAFPILQREQEVKKENEIFFLLLNDKMTTRRGNPAKGTWGF